MATKLLLSAAAGSALLMSAVSVRAEIVTEEVIYTVGDQELTGYLAYDDAVEGTRPGVLVVHEWWGHNDFVRSRAERLAGLGYTAFALDMYGTGKVADHPDQANEFMMATFSDIDNLTAKFDAAHALLDAHETSDPDQTAAIGYCFGGAVVLHMARFGKDLAAVASFHGSLGTQAPAEAGAVTARVLAATGGADPLVPAEQVAGFVLEMQAAGAWVEVVAYPGVLHSFTNPGADAFAEQFGMPVGYDAEADADSWTKMQRLFDQVFAE